MKQRLLKSLIGTITLTVALGSMASDDKNHWGYEGAQGPSHWGDLSEKYTTCKTGKSQSPIDIHGAKAVSLAEINFNYQETPIDVVNNGHTIQLNYAKGSSISVGGKVYNLLQFHFHSPSEHTVDGKPYAMVAHLVHQAADGQLGVIGVLMKTGQQNAVIDSIWQNLPKHAGEHKQAATTLNVADLLPTNHDFYNYSGSLTTPPCSEGVNWMVLQTPVDVSADQVATFTNIFQKSVRPIQPLHGRAIHASK